MIDSGFSHPKYSEGLLICKGTAIIASHQLACCCLTFRSPDNPEGYIALAVAENRLTTDLVQQGLQAHTSFPAHMLYYQDMRGIAELRQAIAGMLQDSFMQV
jgi:hypothetical protein